MNGNAITFLVVIFGTLAAGIGSGAIAHYMGNTSLAGISSPQENPTQQYVQSNNNEVQEFSLIEEQEIIKRVNEIRQRHKNANK